MYNSTLRKGAERMGAERVEYWLRPGGIEKNRRTFPVRCAGKPVVAALEWGRGAAIGPFASRGELLGWVDKHPLYHGNIETTKDGTWPGVALRPDHIHLLWEQGLTGDPERDRLLLRFKDALGLV